jgi:NADH dehydrogenase/NADH:ubiquinone oxidoreductase subunit G
MSNIGHNNPPPEIAFSLSIDDLYDEARNFLDGEPIETEGQANAVGIILTSLRKIRKDADAARADEKRPHDDAAKAVQAKWKPLLEKADRVINAAQRPLTDYLVRQESARIAEAERLAEEARKAEQQAQAAMQNVASLDDAERSEQLVKDANKLAKAAKRTDKAKSHVAGMDRAIGLRTYWNATVTDYSALLRYMKEARPEDLKAMLRDYASAQVRAGSRHIPGVLIEQEKRVA